MTIADLIVELHADDARLRRDVMRSADDVGDRAGKSLGSKLSAGIGHALKAGTIVAAAGIIALTAALGGGIKAAADFQTAMLNVNSIAKASPADFADMQKAVLDLSRELPQSAATLAEGLYDIASSGFAGKQGLLVLRAAAKAASAGLATTADSAKGITAVLNAYGLEAKDAAKVSDVLFKVVDRGVITFPELANVIGTTTALAAPLGVSLEEVGAGIATLTKNGIGAENAVTQLNAIMTSMLKPSQEATDLAKELGIDWSAAGLKANGLVGSLDELIRATGGSEAQMAILLGDSRAIRGAFVLAKEGGEEFRNELLQMEAALGATDVALSYQEKGLGFQLEILKNNILAAGITILGTFLPALTEAVKGATGWLQANEPLIASITTGLVGALGQLIGFLAQVIPMIATFVGQLIGGAQRIGTEVGPSIQSLATQAFGFLLTVVRDVGPAIADLARRFAGLVNVIVTQVAPKVLQFVRTVWEGGLNVAVAAAGRIIGRVVDALAGLLTWITSNRTLMAVLGVVARGIGAAFAAVFGAIESVVNWLGDMVAAIRTNRPTMKTLETVTGALGTLFVALWTAVSKVFDFLGDMFSKITSNKHVMAAFKLTIDGIGGVFNTVASAISAAIEALKTFISWAEKAAKWAFRPVSTPQTGTQRFPGDPTRRQHGGPVAAGQPVIVGERGPELFWPTSAGNILADSIPTLTGSANIHHVVEFRGQPPAGITARDVADILNEWQERLMRGIEHEATLG